LYDPITNGRNAQRALLSIRFLDVHPPRRTSHKLFRLESGVQAILIPVQIGLPHAHVHAVASGSFAAGVLPNVFIRQP